MDETPTVPTLPVLEELRACYGTFVEKLEKSRASSLGEVMGNYFRAQGNPRVTYAVEEFNETLNGHVAALANDLGSRPAEEAEALALEALEQILSRQLTVAQTDALVDQLLSPPPRTRTKRTFVVKDVRLFLNTLTRSMALMRSAGVDARCDRQDKDGEILLTIRIPQAIR